MQEHLILNPDSSFIPRTGRGGLSIRCLKASRDLAPSELRQILPLGTTPITYYLNPLTAGGLTWLVHVL